jgi:hypothetical protein
MLVDSVSMETQNRSHVSIDGNWSAKPKGSQLIEAIRTNPTKNGTYMFALKASLMEQRLLFFSIIGSSMVIEKESGIRSSSDWCE